MGYIDPEQLASADRYKLLIGAIVPRPIAWVSTVSAEGRPNLAPFSFFNGAGSTPMSLLFCPANKADGSMKDTLRNCLPEAEGGTGEFVVNVVRHAQAGPMSVTAEELPYGESEWSLAGLEAEASGVVRPGRVKGSPLAFECRTHQVIRLAAGVPGGANVVIGRVVAVWAEEGLVNARQHVDAAKLDAIGRMGGDGYCTTRDRLSIPRGRGALPGGG
jgi:flavin reductase (DIM6/NTAB) family NADH-FMN oxidoreductase RutF